MPDQEPVAQQPEESQQAVEESKAEVPANEESITSTSAATNKRKRDASDQDDAATGEAASNKRATPPKGATNHTNSDVEMTTGESNAAAEEDGQNAAASQLDFESMAQHSSTEQVAQQNGGPDPGDASTTAAAALAGLYPTMTVPQPTDLSFASTGSAGEGDRSNVDPSFGMGEGDQTGNQSFDIDSIGRDGQPQSAGSQKPAVGSEEWHRVRRDNHKEGEFPSLHVASHARTAYADRSYAKVERRRRETINEGINELAKIVPGCEKNKGSILQRAVAFITQLKENEAQNIEKWTLEKLLTEQAIAELSASVDKLKNECERAWREAETWKKTCQSAGINAKQGDEEVAPAGNTAGGAGNSNGES